MTLIERVKIKKTIRRFKIRIQKELFVRRIASFALLAAAIPVNVLPITSAHEQNALDSTNIKLATTTPFVLANETKTSSIVPGESKVDREVREKSEAKAKARAEAQAKADAEKASRDTVSRERRVYNDPSNFDEIYQKASWYAGGIDPRLLKAVHQVETGGSGSTNRQSYAGAQGPMQFLPSTWRHYGVDGNGDGYADINNVEDAIFTAAAYLKACGYPDIQKALWGYNPSTAYYNKVISYAHSYGM